MVWIDCDDCGPLAEFKGPATVQGLYRFILDAHRLTAHPGAKFPARVRFEDGAQVPFKWPAIMPGRKAMAARKT